MKLIDRYLLKTLLEPLAYCLLAFSMIFIIADLFDNLEDVMRANAPLPTVVVYYLRLLPSIAHRIVPVSMLLAVLYSLYSLTKSNELTAMRASGVSLTRLMTPFIVVGFLTSATVAIVHEWAGPNTAFWCHQTIREMRSDTPAEESIARNIGFRNTPERRYWVISEFNVKTLGMRGIDIIQQRPDGSDEYKIKAQEAKWIDDHWWLLDVQKQYFDPEGNPMGAPQLTITMEMTEYDESPRLFLKEVKDPNENPEFLSALEMQDYIENHKNLQKDTRRRLETDLHSRIAMPWACLVVTLLGIPFGNQTGRKGAILGIALSLAMFVSYYFLMVIGSGLGKQLLVAPWLAAWIPNIVFLIIGATMIYRMR